MAQTAETIQTAQAAQPAQAAQAAETTPVGRFFEDVYLQDANHFFCSTPWSSTSRCEAAAGRSLRFARLEAAPLSSSLTLPCCQRRPWPSACSRIGPGPSAELYGGPVLAGVVIDMGASAALCAWRRWRRRCSPAGVPCVVACCCCTGHGSLPPIPFSGECTWRLSLCSLNTRVWLCVGHGGWRWLPGPRRCRWCRRVQWLLSASLAPLVLEQQC